MAKSESVAIIGTGGIGARHLQALSTSEVSRICVADPNAANREAAIRLYRQGIEDLGSRPAAVIETDTVDAVSEEYDIAIIATQAKGRLRILEDTISQIRPSKVILEKVAFQSVAEFDLALDLIAAGGIDAWVNCSRRMWPVYIELRDALRSEQPFTCEVLGRGFPLGSNAIHFIDLLQFLSGCSDIAIDGSELSEPFPDLKRPGTIDFSGSLTATTARGDRMILQRTGTDVQPPFSCTMTLACADFRWTYDQHDDQTRSWRESAPLDVQEKAAPMPFQSQLTATIIEDILNSGSCPLTPLVEAYAGHAPLLTTFLNREEQSTGVRSETCRIT